MDTPHHNPAEGNGHPYVPSPAEIAVGYERRDVKVRTAVVFTIVFVASLLVIHGIIVGVSYVLYDMQDSERAIDHREHPMTGIVNANATLTRNNVPPGPLLEPSVQHDFMPQEDLAEVRAQQKHQLESYGWVNRQSGVAHIPLAAVTDMVVDSGLPTTLPATQPSSPTMPPASSLYGPGVTPP